MGPHRWGGALTVRPIIILSIRCVRDNRRILLLPFSASWMLTVFATSVEMLLATAFLVGLCSAIVIVVSQVSRRIRVSWALIS